MNKFCTTVLCSALVACSAVPASAQAQSLRIEPDLLRSTNEFCANVVRLNNTTGRSAAPGTLTAIDVSLRAGQTHSTYADLWSFAKRYGDYACFRMW